MFPAPCLGKPAIRISLIRRGDNYPDAGGPGAANFLTEVARNGGHLGGTTSRLLRLLDQFGPAALQSALVEAHGRGAFAAHSVAHVLERQRRDRGTPIPLSVTLPNDPRVQDLVVTPHSLDRYDRLGQSLDTADTTEASP